VFGGAAGLLCLVWGFLGLSGIRRRIGPGLTLGLTAFVLLAETVTRWLPSSNGKPTSLLFTIVMTVMLVLTLALLGWMLPREDFVQPGAAGTQRKQEPDATKRKSA
jgi:hypothetical protein